MTGDTRKTHESGSSTREGLGTARRTGQHVAAILGGAALTVAGLGMGVSLVLLPIGIPVGLIGVLLLVWGLFAWSRD